MAEPAHLDERKASILHAVVKEYIATAQPVGSSKISDAAALNVSSATVRNELVQLETDGYLHQPHTSAGRIPTDKGYRFFVDHLTGPPRLGKNKKLQVTEFFDQTHTELEMLLRDTSRLLAGLTDCAAVVTGPGSDAATIRSVQLVDLVGHTVLAVAVLSSGAIEKRTIEIESTLAGETLGRASEVLDTSFKGAHLGSLPDCVVTGVTAVDDLVATATAALAVENSHDPVYVGGRSRVAESFDAVETVREVLGLLERQFIVVSLVREVLGRGQSVAIGNETGVDDLAECSLVVAPYDVDGESVGSIAILGPTRMDYSQALAAVTVVGSSLGDRLGTG